ncbi:MAG TPA: spore germination protein, partial [Clostridiaceae bacterium]|nr:spore germination protein [Clostridiaceae bacterium]
MKKRNIFIRLISLITYKEKQKPREFVIPEIGEEQNVSASQEQVQPKKEENKKRRPEKKRKPVSVQDLDKKNKEKESKYKTGKQQDAVFCSIRENIDYIRKQFNYPANSGIIIREFLVAGERRAFITYLDGMADGKTISDFILRPLLNTDKFNAIQEGCPLEYILFSVLEANQVKKVTKAKEVIDEILLGNTGIYVDGCNYYIFCETTGYEKRSV